MSKTPKKPFPEPALDLFWSEEALGDSSSGQTLVMTIIQNTNLGKRVGLTLTKAGEFSGDSGELVFVSLESDDDSQGTKQEEPKVELASTRSGSPGHFGQTRFKKSETRSRGGGRSNLFLAARVRKANIILCQHHF